ncbi:helix-turn-helix transcriptional regulator [Streptomyces kaniharaensis]|uniref:Helix-turn-helix transcriptional regulator n=1 Tax=Streptomyces kaniharaensis TaxID=212423 RepID=A0A6N7L5G3_9ACTN|nr:helix-turn-helix transcriptional regulator [Streptomyces kaniharaensis]MQS17604.1 helix-turn-helix transcriptional regulator [Streptomyces kaniharaensis]
MENTVLQQARRVRGWTQEKVAVLVQAWCREEGLDPGSFDATTVSRLECGRIRWPRDEVRQALRAVFKVKTDAELGLVGTRRPRPQTREVSPTERRTFLSLGAVAVLPDIAPAPSRLGADDVRGLDRHTAALEEWDRRSGGRATRHFAGLELRRAVDLGAASMTPSVRTAWSGAVARLAGLYAWTSFDAGEKGAVAAFDLALDAAREAGDALAYCHIATNAARQAVHEGGAERALALTASASGPHPPAVLAMVSAVTAQALALQGDIRGVMRSVAAAEGHASRAGDSAQGGWMQTLTPAKLRSDLGYALYRLAATIGHLAPDLVPQLRRTAGVSEASQPRARAMGAARLATVLFRQGDVDEARHHAAVAVGLASAVGSARLDSAITEMRAAAA